MQKKDVLFLIFLVYCISLYSQGRNQGFDFHPPVDPPLRLSGNFGEFRSNHFHSGVDFKTGGKTGKPVYAVEAGYVSRIKVSPVGYGKALYVTHPNGIVSLYGHLNKYNNAIGTYVKQVQYKKQSYAFDVYLPPGVLQVEKGEIIAYSGNSGSSGGPHLHFEFRDAITEFALNPLLYNFTVKDTRNPVIYELQVYPLTENSIVMGQYENYIGNVKLMNNGNFAIKENEITAWGDIGFSIRAFDYLNGSHNKCGIYSVEFYIDSVLSFKNAFDRFSFYEWHYINSLIDYSYYKSTRRHFQKTYKDPHNELSVLKHTKDSGILTINQEKTYHVQFILTDVAGNTSKLKFQVIGKHPGNIVNETNKNKGELMDFDKENYIIREDFRLSFPEKAFYKPIYFQFTKSSELYSEYSHLYDIGDEYIPLHEKYTLSIKAHNLTDTLQNKALIAKINKRGKVSAVGGKWIQGFITTKLRYFGSFFITVDTIAPEIRILDAPRKNNASNKIVFKISDDLSGIKTYNAYIDGKWALFEYDKKRKLIFHEMDPSRIIPGKKHSLHLSIVDYRNNEADYTGTFYW